jgi:hypothetical protein
MSFNGQQQKYPNHQYAQPQQQQFTGALHHSYMSTAQQTPSESTFVQQSVSQPLYQSLMQQVPTQQPLPSTQPQQPSYQHHNQRIDNVVQASSAVAGSSMQTQQPDEQWQTATNSTSTTTTTTTTTKTTKETQASWPGYTASTVASDFASLMQQPPQQQPLQQQHTVNYSQASQSGHQQQTLPPPTIDYAQLMQSSPPQTPNTVDFSQLLQAAPPQPRVAQVPPILSSTPTERTTASATSVVGSTSRQKAADSGKAELQRFDRVVSDRLKQFNQHGVCPKGWDYYATRQGYLCGGATHFVSHEDVEAMLAGGRTPRIEKVNAYPPRRMVTPPPADGRLDGSREMPVWNDPQWWDAWRLTKSMNEIETMGSRGSRGSRDSMDLMDLIESRGLRGYRS